LAGRPGQRRCHPVADNRILPSRLPYQLSITLQILLRLRLRLLSFAEVSQIKYRRSHPDEHVLWGGGPEQFRLLATIRAIIGAIS